MKSLKFVLAILVGVTMSCAAHAGSWKAAGPWAADYGEDYCDLGRVFTDGKNQLTFMIERTQPGPFLRLMLVGEGVRPFRGAAQWSVKFGPTGQVWKAPILMSKTGDGKQYYDLGQTMISPSPPPAPGSPPVFKPYKKDEERGAAKPLTAFEMGEGLVEPMTLETGSLDAPIGALQACVSDLVASWGLDAKRHDTLRAPCFRKARQAPGCQTARSRSRNSGSFWAGGTPSLSSSMKPARRRSARFSDLPSPSPSTRAICDAITKNAKFTPALDSAGQAMPSYWITEVFGLDAAASGRPSIVGTRSWGDTKRAALRGRPFRSPGAIGSEANADAAQKLVAFHILLVIGVAIFRLGKELVAEVIFEAGAHAQAIAIVVEPGAFDAGVGIACFSHKPGPSSRSPGRHDRRHRCRALRRSGRRPCSPRPSNPSARHRYRTRHYLGGSRNRGPRRTKSHLGCRVRYRWS